MNGAGTLSRRRLDEHGRALLTACLIVFPVAFTAVVLIAEFTKHNLASDFSLAYYPAASRLLAGHSPYAATAHEIRQGAAFVYPPLAATLFAPFALMGPTSASHVYMTFCLLLVPLTLWLMGVRDWRIYALTLLWRPVLNGWQQQNVSVPLACIAALAWRYRERPFVAGLAVAAAASFKPLMWPLVLWLLASRRWRASAWTMAWGLVLNLFALLIVGFGRIHAYLHATSLDVGAAWHQGYSVTAAVHHLGGSRSTGEVVVVAFCAILGLGVIRSGLRGRSAHAFGLAIALMLVSSPLVWGHYFALLLLPVALARPRLSLLWFVPLVMWVCPLGGGAGWQVAVAWGTSALCFGAVLRHSRPEGERADRAVRTGRPPELAVSGSV